MQFANHIQTENIQLIELNKTKKKLNHIYSGHALSLPSLQACHGNKGNNYFK